MLLSPDRIAPGLPGIYRLARPTAPALTDERMDVCGFVGIAARGPAWQPVLDTGEPDDRRLVRADRALRRSVPVMVESFDAYRRQFGGAGGPGYLGASVASFFDQGGRRAYVVRILPPRPMPEGTLFEGCAEAGLKGFEAAPLKLHARNPGTWGASLKAKLTFRRIRLSRIDIDKYPDRLVFDGDTAITEGDFLSIGAGGGHFVRQVEALPRERLGGRRLAATLEGNALPPVDAAIEQVIADLSLSDAEGNAELHGGLGFAPAHPRWLADILVRDSQLAWPDPAWAEAEIRPVLTALGLPAPAEVSFAGGDDGATAAVSPDHMFDAGWEPGDDAGDGVHALLEVAELTHVVIPDLYHPWQPPERLPPPPELASPRFDLCVTLPPRAEPQPVQPPRLALDPQNPHELDEIIELQRRLVDLAETCRSFIALLDVPPGLVARRVAQWRGLTTSRWAAAYGPWCLVAGRDGSPDSNRLVPPSAVAAGIIAASEWQYGVPHGPANRIAAEVVGLGQRLEAAEQGPLHQSGINLFTRDSDGVTLRGARTLALETGVRQLSVCRMLLKLRRMLARQMQWTVFEPANEQLLSTIEVLIGVELRRLWLAGALQGTTASEAYFVRADRDRRRLDRGEVLIEVGVALAEPLEFLMIRLVRGGDGTLQLESAA